MSVSLIGIVTAIYVGVALTEWRNGRMDMCIVFGGYAIANLGLIWAALR